MTIKAKLNTYNEEYLECKTKLIKGWSTENDKPHSQGIELNITQKQDKEERTIFISFSELQKIKRFLK